MDLGFGKCRLQVQVPEKGPLQSIKDLIGKNIVTSFTGLAEDYFARLEGQGSRKESVNGTESPVPKLKTRIKYIGGSVEAACALGVADGIVDLVESGETMRAAGLKAIDTVVESTARPDQVTKNIKREASQPHCRKNTRSHHCSAICAVSVQHSSIEAATGFQDYTWQASADSNVAG